MNTKLSGPTRCVIRCSREEFDKGLQDDQYGTSFVERVVAHASGDYKKASLLVTYTGESAMIVFDYDNPNPYNTCRVLGFRIKRSIKPILVPAEDVHRTIKGLLGGSALFPLLLQKSPPSSTHNLNNRPPSNTATNSSITAKRTEENQDTNSESTRYAKKEGQNSLDGTKLGELEQLNEVVGDGQRDGQHEDSGNNMTGGG